VLSGRLKGGARVPSSRVLAADHDVARITAVEAYDRLVAEGFLTSRPGSGLFVAAAEGEPKVRLVAGTPRRQRKRMPELSRNDQVFLVPERPLGLLPLSPDRHAAAAGLVGATIEDLTPTRRKDKPLFDIGEATERVAAAVAATRKLGFPFMLTARAEGLRHGNTDLDDAIKRLQAYEKAGADVLMAPGLPDLASVKVVCGAIAKPFNFMAGIPGMSFTVAELEAAGVRRISLAGSLYRAAMGGLVAAARELKDKRTFSYVDTAALPSAELAGFMRG
jgi:Phosphoenolpyruvate phosphomutase/Bacterial regulatory proteins, gntR family